MNIIKLIVEVFDSLIWEYSCVNNKKMCQTTIVFVKKGIITINGFKSRIRL